MNGCPSWKVYTQLIMTENFFAELCGRVLSIEGYKRGEESLTMSNIWIKQGSSKTLLNISTSYL